jgi:putative drug exporter of the RND superfamily
MHRITRRLGDASARRPKRVVVSWLVALVAFAVLSAVAGGTPTDDFVAPGSQSAQAQELLQDRFPDAANGRALAVFAAPAGDSVEAHRAAISSALEEVGNVEGVVAVRDPFVDATVSADGRVGYATLAFDQPNTRVGKPAITAVDEALAAARDDGLVAEVGGDAAFVNSETKASGAEVVGIVAALFILVLAFGAAVAAVVPIVLALVAVGIGLSGVTLAMASFDVSDAATVIGTMVGLGVAIDYALLVVSRYRENRQGGADDRRALSDAMASVGSAVAFAGGTVVLAMLALLLVGVGFLSSIGLSVAFVVVVAVAAALTLLPALLTLLGSRIDRGHLRLPGRAARPAPTLEDTSWWRFAHRVSRRPWAWLVAGTVVLLALAAPAVSLQTGFPDAGDNPTSTSERRAYDLLGDAFGPGINGPLLLVVDLTRDGATEADLSALTSGIAEVQGVASVGEATTSPAGDTVVVPVVPTTAPTDEATTATLQRVRDQLPANASVTGLTAMTDDLTAQLADKLPVFIGAVLVAGFLLMTLVFRSIVVPLKAALLNLLSIGAAYGVVVAIFQWGWLAPLFGLDQTYNVISPMPIIFFAVLFGLSVDYEVFLISRIREEYDASGDPLESVARGVAATGRVISSAALIMTAVFMAFVLNPSPLIMMIGVGLATAILVDATIVRMVLVPASMALLGRANWWLPAALDRRLNGTAAHAPVEVPRQRPMGSAERIEERTSSRA